MIDNGWYYRANNATPEEAARCEAAWARINAIHKSGSGIDPYQKTGTCKRCGQPCWDHFLVCGPCDQKAGS